MSADQDVASTDPPVRPQPLIAVADVPASSAFYQCILGARSGHGGEQYERLMVGESIVAQLHRVDETHHHGAFALAGVPLGNGVALWFEVAQFDTCVARAREAGAQVEADVHVNPNTGYRELWLRDPDRYLVVLAERAA